ncbi:MAG: Holliday junction resolvase RecU [Acetanaerobacterium sp.]
MMDIYGGKNPTNILRGRQNRAQGELFEKIIMASCDYYRERGIAHIEKTPEPFHVTKSCGAGCFYGNFAKQAQPDFKGTLRGGRTIVFEAKHTDADRIKQDRVSQIQTDELNTCELFGAVCAVIVSFGMQGIYMVPWDTWRNMPLIFGRKYITAKDVAQYKRRFTGALIMLFDMEGDHAYGRGKTTECESK